MKLLISVINRDDLYGLTDALVRAGYGATVINTTGGFLREGNATLLIGVEEDGIKDVLQIIQENCRSRTKQVVPFPSGPEAVDALMVTPVQVRVGGAVVFTVDIERSVRF
jgi:uncharacterized protein YaaQ